MIPFKRRELQRAWRNARDASNVQPRTNPHRLLLFYAIECGLKAACLKRNNEEIFDEQFVQKIRPQMRSSHAEDKKVMQHNLNEIMELLRMAKDYLLPVNLTLLEHKEKGDNKKNNPRQCGVGDLNQVWRYGGILDRPGDAVIEAQLEKINLWIAKELT